MKKTIITLSLLFVSGLLAGQVHPIKPLNANLNQWIAATYDKPEKDPLTTGTKINPSWANPIRSTDEYQIGTTWYDLQTNHMINSRIYFYPENSSIAAVWTYGNTPSNFPERGTGYNYFNGSDWLPQPTARIENERTGWPSYAPWGENGEMVLAHLNVGLKLSRRPVRGEGDWTYVFVPGPAGAPEIAWPRIVTSGDDRQTVHMLANSYTEYEGQDLALLYSRSQDGGDSWDIQPQVIDGLGADYYTQIYSDSWCWAEPLGDTLAFVVASSWNDLVLMKSFDNGDSWEKTVIWEHPYPFFDWDVTITDSFFCVDNSASVAMDASGKAHVVFGIGRVIHSEPGNTYWYTATVDGIGYWNEDMEPFSNDLYALSPPQWNYPSSEMIESYNYVGWTQDVDGDGEITFLDDFFGYSTHGLSTQPSITIDEQGRIFFAYASTTETYDNIEYNLKHIWSRAYSEEGGWTEFIDITSDIVHIFDECIFPVIASNSDGFIHLIYNTDATPGLALNDDHGYQENKTIYARLDKYDFYPWGIEDQQPEAIGLQAKVYPNPLTSNSLLEITVPVSTELRVEFFNSSGQSVGVIDKGLVNPGLHHIAVGSKVHGQGIYLYRVAAGNGSYTGKMMVVE